MRKMWGVRALGLALGLVLAGGCGSGRTVTGVPNPGGNPDGNNGGNNGGAATVDFATQIQPIFTDNCAFSGCHAADTASGGMVLDEGQAYANLVNVTSSEVAPDKRVVPGNSGASYIIEKLTSTQPRSGAQMPLGSNLPADLIELIRTWIDEGAHPALQ
jgi:hypothetical protein